MRYKTMGEGLAAGIRSRPPVEHELKCWPKYFRALWDERKTFEYRKDDRDYQEGDRLWIREWDPTKEEYTGLFAQYTVGYILRGGEMGVPDGMCILSIHPYGSPEADNF